MILGALGEQMRATALPCGRLVGFYLPADSVTAQLWDAVPMPQEAANDG